MKPGKRYRRRIVYHFCNVPPTQAEIDEGIALRLKLELEKQQLELNAEEENVVEAVSETGTEKNGSENKEPVN